MAATIVLSLIYFKEYKKKESIPPFKRIENTFEEESVKPVGIIEYGNTPQEIKYIRGYIKEFDDEKIIIGGKKGSEEKLFTIVKNNDMIVHLKADYHGDEIGFDVVNALPEELENFYKEGNYVEIMCNEIIRENEETSYHALTILFFP